VAERDPTDNWYEWLFLVLAFMAAVWLFLEV
jgi:hypothetical protein